MRALAEPQQEFTLLDSDFVKLTGIVKQRAGIVLSEQKRALVYGRLSRRLRALGLSTFTEYCNYLDSSEGDGEFRNLVNAITTNLTGFFREPHHFEFLAKETSSILTKGSAGRLRIWSAGCSSGEEPYSIAMTVRKAVGEQGRHDVKILATDIDTEMVAFAKAGRYNAEKAALIPGDLRSKFVRRVDDTTVDMSDNLKSMITFKELNLFDTWPMAGPFDIIFCRNVIIYFDNEAKKALFDRYANLLKPGGWMIIGHSENLFRISSRFHHIGKTIYQRVS